ncbi:hypothetical protein B0H17DRAFT_1133772 [Mycena rosella]|uniref:Uncharacterized protein n=1 Tax=Mycena rosella TaxID=1033263 RepID=A0AAD7GEQ0_MYCRO|nr:hypothetical protein B0H17DRAFT_1133772 [Mycena rosella]
MVYMEQDLVGNSGWGAVVQRRVWPEVAAWRRLAETSLRAPRRSPKLHVASARGPLNAVIFTEMFSNTFPASVNGRQRFRKYTGSKSRSMILQSGRAGGSGLTRSENEYNPTWRLMMQDRIAPMDDTQFVGSISFRMLLEFRGTQFPAPFIVANPSLFLELDWGHPARPRTFLETRSQPVPLQPAVSVKSEPSMASVRPGSPLRVKSEPDSGQRSFLQPRSLEMALHAITGPFPDQFLAFGPLEVLQGGSAWIQPRPVTAGYLSVVAPDSNPFADFDFNLFFAMDTATGSSSADFLTYSNHGMDFNSAPIPLSTPVLSTLYVPDVHIYCDLEFGPFATVPSPSDYAAWAPSFPDPSMLGNMTSGLDVFVDARSPGYHMVETELPILCAPSPLPASSPPPSTPDSSPQRPQKRIRGPEVNPANILTSTRARVPSTRVLESRGLAKKSKKKVLRASRHFEP